MFLEFGAGLLNLINAIYNHTPNGFTNFNLIGGTILIILGILFMKLGLHSRKKIKALEKEKMVRE